MALTAVAVGTSCGSLVCFATTVAFFSLSSPFCCDDIILNKDIQLTTIHNPGTHIMYMLAIKTCIEL